MSVVLRLDRSFKSIQTGFHFLKHESRYGVTKDHNGPLRPFPGSGHGPPKIDECNIFGRVELGLRREVESLR